jgi:hypothetical protein
VRVLKGALASVHLSALGTFQHFATVKGLEESSPAN